MDVKNRLPTLSCYGPSSASWGPFFEHCKMNEEAPSRGASSRLRVVLLNMTPSQRTPFPRLQRLRYLRRHCLRCSNGVAGLDIASWGVGGAGDRDAGDREGEGASALGAGGCEGGGAGATGTLGDGAAGETAPLAGDGGTRDESTALITHGNSGGGLSTLLAGAQTHGDVCHIDVIVALHGDGYGIGNGGESTVVHDDEGGGIGAGCGVGIDGVCSSGGDSIAKVPTVAGDAAIRIIAANAGEGDIKRGCAGGGCAVIGHSDGDSTGGGNDAASEAELAEAAVIIVSGGGIASSDAIDSKVIGALGEGGAER